MMFGGYFTPSYLTQGDYIKGSAQDENFGTSGLRAAERALGTLEEETFSSDEDF